MCGIAGFLHFEHKRQIMSSVIKKMTDTISYRGPDGEGFYIHKNLAMGHRRLSIIDLNTGDQPMYNNDKSIVVVFNGEIYNYIELKVELVSYGHTFLTTSDTEVIIKSYQQWGVECQNKFNGMWAFALWDEKKQQLLLSRDRIGEKPLHYAIFDNTLIFGSEIKSILAYGMPTIQNLELLEIFLSLGYIPAPYTFYKNINKLKAGHYLTICGNEIKEHQYWDLPDIDENNMLRNKNEIYEQFESLFRNSIKIRMRSDVPYGAFLSGGLDSSSVVAIMSEISSFPVETFTIGFKEKHFDERYLAKIVANKFQTNHHEHIVEPGSFNESLNKIVTHYDEPFGDSSAIPTGFVSKFASSKVKMVLTGDGGDEVLSGYNVYQSEKFTTHYQKLPGWVKNAMPDLTSCISKPFHGSLRYKLNRVQDIFKASNSKFIDRYRSKAIWIDEIFIKRLTMGLKVHPFNEFLNDFEAKCKYHDPFYKMMYFNQKLSLPDDMLVKVDRMSMAYSLETRAPFLDYRLIEFLNKVDKEIKMNHFERKSILRKTVGCLLPNSVLSAPKRGFTVPLREWFKEDSFNEKLSTLNLTMPYLNKGVISDIYSINRRGEKDFGNFIWMLFILQKIMENGKE